MVQDWAGLISVNGSRESGPLEKIGVLRNQVALAG